MKFKKLVILIVALAVLIAAALVKKARENGPDQKKPSPAVKVLRETLSPAFVQKVVLSKADDAGEKIVLRKDNANEWILESRVNTRARKDRVEALIKNVTELGGEIRSESKEVLKDFSLLESQAIQIQLRGAEDKVIASVLVSPLRPTGGLNFVRLADSDRVIVASPDILSTLGIYAKSDKLDDKLFADLQAVKPEPSNPKPKLAKT